MASRPRKSNPHDSSARSGPDPEILRRGCALLREGNPEAAMQQLRPAFEEYPAHAQLRSHYGLALGLARRRYHEALQLCQSAAKQEHFDPAHYLNVARLHLAYGFRAEALRCVRRAQMIDPVSPEAAALVERLGLRSRPVLPFLPRPHLLNRWLGAARAVLLRRSSSETS